MVAFSTLFNIPKFFEVEILIELDWEITNKIGYNSTTNETIEVSKNIKYLFRSYPKVLKKVQTKYLPLVEFFVGMFVTPCQQR